MDLHDLKPPIRVQDRYGYIYHTLFTRPTDGREFHYIGQHISSVLDRRYFGSGLLIRRMVAKYGLVGNVYVSVICWCTDQDTLNLKEIYYIKEARRLWKKDCINLMYGGVQGTMHANTRRKIGDANRGRIHSPEERRKRAESNRGRVVSIKTRIKISKSKTGVPQSRSDRQKKSEALTAFYASPEGTALRKNIRLRQLGGKRSVETRIQMSISAQNRPTLRCPHCHKEGNISGMKRWHFDNCRM